MTRVVAALFALCLAASPAFGQNVTAEDDAVVNTGPGNAVRTGDNSTVTIIQGYTIEQHEAALVRREAQIRADLERVSSLERELLLRQIGDIESKRADLQGSYEKATRELTDLRNRLSDIGDGIPQQKIDEAKQALFEGDRSKADALFAQVEAMEQESIDRAAAAAFERGKIAEQEVRWHDAAKHYERAATLVPDAEHLTRADEFLWRSGNARRAVRYAEDYLRLVVDEHGGESTQAARGYNGLALKFKALGEYEKAEPLYRKALRIGKATIGETHPAYATGLANLATLLRDMGRYDEAEPLYRKALRIGKATIGETHPYYAIHLANLALLLLDMGRNDEAEPLFRQALRIDKATIGETHPDYATRLNNLALLLLDMGRYDEAEPLFRQAIEIGKATIGETHPDYATHLNNLASLLRNMGRYDAAEPLFRQAIEIDKATIGETHPESATRLNNLALLLWDMGRYDEAEPLFRQAIEIDKATIGETHPGYATYLNNLALLLRDTGRYDEARPLWIQMHEIHLASLGLDHPQTKRGAANYARLLRAHFPDDPALAELVSTFGPDIGR